jgi:YVTN family beta-propeller protein
MAKLIVIKRVANNGVGNKNPSDFTITVSGNHPSPSSFSGNAREGTIVSLRPGSYKVTESGPSSSPGYYYVSIFSSDCSGRKIDAGQMRICSITNEAKKLPPFPSPLPRPSPLPMIVTTIKGFSGPIGLAYDAVNKNVYATNYGKNAIVAGVGVGKVSVMDSSTNTVIDTVSVGKKPQAIAYNPGNADIYVANTFSNTVSVINTLRNSNNNVIATIPVGNFPGNSSNGIAYVPMHNGNDKMYVANMGSGTVSVIDSSTNTLTHNIKGFFNPSGIAYDSGNGNIYVTDRETNTVSVINILRNNVIATIPVGASPSAITYDDANGDIYVANSGASSTHSRDGTVSVIDSSTNKVIATIRVGAGPNGVVYNSDNGKIYVANTFSNNVSVVDDSTNNVIATIRVGINPYGVVYNPSNHHVYVANYGSNNISVIRS